jgi:HEAT repeat protein
VEALGKIGGAQAVEALTNALKSENSAVRAAADEALKQIHHKE